MNLLNSTYYIIVHACFLFDFNNLDIIEDVLDTLMAII